MNKTIIIGIVVIVLLAVVGYLVTSNKEVAPGGDGNSNVEQEVSGTVVSVNTEQVAVDGPALVTVQTEDGEVVVAVPSMGINLCAARDNIADVYELSSGDEVAVLGSVGENDMIIPCESADHYLRVVGE